MSAVRRELLGSGRRSQRTVARGTGYLATVVVLVGLWSLAAATGLVSPQVLPSPGAVVSAAEPLVGHGELWSSLEGTALRILLSVVIGGVVGVALGSVLWKFAWLWSALRPYLTVSYSLPLVVFYPTLLVLFGLNDWPIVVLTSIMTTIPIALNTTLGLQGVPQVLVEVGRTLDRSAVQIFHQILLPMAWPSILAGMKLAVVYGIVGVVAMEFIAGSSGLGYRIETYYEEFNVPAMYVYIVTTLVLSAFCIGAVLFIERLTTRGWAK